MTLDPLTAIEERLEEVEHELSRLEPLTEERERLVQARDVLTPEQPVEPRERRGGGRSVAKAPAAPPKPKPVSQKRRPRQDDNGQKVLDYLRRHGPASRQVIAEGTGLKPATLSSVLRRLGHDGLTRSTGHTRNKVFHAEHQSPNGAAPDDLEQRVLELLVEPHTALELGEALDNVASLPGTVKKLVERGAVEESRQGTTTVYFVAETP